MARKNKIPTKNQIGQKVGRPALLDDPKVREMLYSAIRIGAHVETAIAFAGIHKDSFYQYCRKGHKQNANGLARQFLDELEKAFADAEMRDLSALDKHVQGGQVQVKWTDKDGKQHEENMPIKSDWRAAAWRLARKYPNRWGQKQIVKMEDGDAPAEGKKDSFQDANFHLQLVDLIEQLEKDKENEE